MKYSIDALAKYAVITEKEYNWGDKLIERLAKDLKEEFPDMKGFSSSNLKYCKRFYLFYQMPIGQQPVDQLQSPDAIIQQLTTKIPWGHNILILASQKTLRKRIFTLGQPSKTAGAGIYWPFN